MNFNMHYKFMKLIAATAYGNSKKPSLTFSGKVNLRAGINTIALLSSAAGLPVRFLFQFFLFPKIS